VEENDLRELRPILLVEDDANDVELTLTALAQHNLANKIVVLRDGAEALDYLHRLGPHTGRTNSQPVVVLLDLKMPKVNGLDVLKQMRADEELRLVPVVMLTSSREERDLVASYQLGVNAYVVKPVSFSEFVSAIQGLGVFWALINEPPPEANSNGRVDQGARA
jgi:CheY-like chemotaxis protein